MIIKLETLIFGKCLLYLFFNPSTHPAHNYLETIMHMTKGIGKVDMFQREQPQNFTKVM
jgi:hypothetical protein